MVRIKGKHHPLNGDKANRSRFLSWASVWMMTGQITCYGGEDTEFSLKIPFEIL